MIDCRTGEDKGSWGRVQFKVVGVVKVQFITNVMVSLLVRGDLKCQ